MFHLNIEIPYLVLTKLQIDLHRSASNQHELTQSVLSSSVVWPGQTTPPAVFEATLYSTYTKVPFVKSDYKYNGSLVWEG